MEERASTKKFTWGKILAVLGTVLGGGLVGTIFTLSGGVLHGDAILRDAVKGAWTLKTTGDMELTYTVSLTPNARQFTGKGLKLGEKWAGGTYTDCKGTACTAFDINGSLDVDGDSLEAWFTEEGERSATQLHLVWKPEKSQWVGTFTSETATSRGPATSSGPASLSRF